MTPSGRRVSLGLCGVIVIGLAGAWALSMLRNDRPQPRTANQHGNPPVADSQNLDTHASEPIRKPAPPRNDYVGSASCAECHPKISRQYATHSMAKSMANVASATLLEDFGEKATFTADARHVYSVEKTADGMNHHERQLDAKGETLFDQSIRVDYAVGSGAHGKSYLIDHQGSMFMSPISWYSSAQRWNLSPGYKLPIHRRFERRITDNCLECHVGRVNFARGWDNHLNQPPFLELSIGCERCHGPGGEHVTFQRGTGTSQDVDPIVNPAKLDPAHREDICAQCHLQGEGRISNYGREVGDFRPGQRLEEFSVVFVKGTRTTADGKSRAVSHVDQMRSSICFQKSEGKFGCTSCHDPHSLPSESDKIDFYREKCLACHQQQSCSLPEPERRKRQANDSCVACHMPPLGASDIPHTSHTDHRVLRIPSAVPIDPKSIDALPEIYDHAEERLPRLTVDRARGLWLADRAEQRTNADFAERAVILLNQVAKQLPDDADVLEALGTASAVGGRMEDSLDYWMKTLTLEPKRESTLRTVALLLHNTNRGQAALPYYERYLEIQPWNGSMWGRYSFLQGKSGDWKGALESAKKSEAIDPSQPRTYQWLSTIYQQLGDEQQSRHYADLFERIKPAPPK